MVKGELRCLGSTQHLKNKYGAGYQLEVNWAFYEFGWFFLTQVKWSGARMNSDWAGLESVLLKIFPGAQVAITFHKWEEKKPTTGRLLALLHPGAWVFLGPSDLFCGAGITLVSSLSINFHSVEQEAVQSLASAFQQLEKCKSDFNIEDYSLSQTTLEQVGRSGKGLEIIKENCSFCLLKLASNVLQFVAMYITVYCNVHYNVLQ